MSATVQKHVQKKLIRVHKISQKSEANIHTISIFIKRAYREVKHTFSKHEAYANFPKYFYRKIKLFFSA